MKVSLQKFIADWTLQVTRWNDEAPLAKIAASFFINLLSIFALFYLLKPFESFWRLLLMLLLLSAGLFAQTVWLIHVLKTHKTLKRSEETNEKLSKTDISQLKTRAENLLESEKRLRTFVEALPDRVIILDADGRYHDVLQSDYNDFPTGESGGVEGQTVYEIFEKEFADFCLSKVRETLEKQSHLVFEYDYAGETRTYYLEGRTLPYIDPRDSSPLVIWITRDITAQRQSSKALEDNQKLLRTIMEALPDRTNIFNKEGVYLDILQAALGNTKLDQMLRKIELGTKIKDIFSPDFAEFCMDKIERTLREEKIQVFEYPSPDPSEFRFFEGRTIPFLNPQTGERDVLWLSRDITERKELDKQRLELALQSKKLEFFKQFVDNLTHDLKTPLAVIKSGLYLLENSPNTSQAGRRIAAINAQVELLKEMIDDMLTISRLDAFEILNKGALDLSQLIETIISELKPNIDKKSLQVGFDKQLTVAKIEGSHSELRRAITNLIDNAINYTPEGGEIRIKLEASQNDYQISVQDTGIGIKPDELPRIFERFYRSEQARFTASGTGLGLAITRRIIELHQGTIQVESEVNKGTRFIVTLPYKTELEADSVPAN